MQNDGNSIATVTLLTALADYRTLFWSRWASTPTKK